MAWIATRKGEENDKELRVMLGHLNELYPPEYGGVDLDGIVGSHSLIPSAMYHAFATFGHLMSDDLPLSRRQQEMIATVVSAANRCEY